ncbi:hypothetical protein Nepgr_032866 [Nepenthes gracilis]|uniref:Uncharacterized protein n=1 Tax=Nepenthes gracilis TaxID=150966 RepID=A0AAD3TJG0_NEPGR|nr:hypothetical protein Nepgr_032866 [Nepenthes gracilis]
MGNRLSQADAEAKAEAEAEAEAERRCRSEATRKAEVDCKLPHNYEAIIKDSDSPVDVSSKAKLYEQLHNGVFLNGRRKKYWVDERGNNCFMLFANDLLITWADTNRYWRWVDLQTSDGLMSVAELISVCWLEVHGRFNTANLSPNVRYEVAYLIMLDEIAFGWEVPINLRIKFCDGSRQECRENLKEKPRKQWIQIPVGEVEECMGEIEFSLFEYESGRWKCGLIIKGVIIHPKM